MDRVPGSPRAPDRQGVLDPGLPGSESKFHRIVIGTEKTIPLDPTRDIEEFHSGLEPPYEGAAPRTVPLIVTDHRWSHDRTRQESGIGPGPDQLARGIEIATFSDDEQGDLLEGLFLNQTILGTAST